MKAQTKTAEATFSSTDLTERTIHRRAMEAITWGIGAVNFDLMFQALTRDARGSVNQILFWSQPCDWKNQFLTAEPRHHLLHAVLQRT